MLRCVDLFAGCGGLSLGFELAGFEMIAAFDYWSAAIEVYQQNFNHPIYSDDLTDDRSISEKIKTMSADILIGGPPCQDYSSAGKRDLTQGRADLTYHFANIVCAVMPQWFVMENVDRIKKSHIFKDIINQFLKQGYGLSSVILNAAFCGVPQSRTRLFLIGHLGDRHNQLNRIFSDRLSLKSMTVKDYLGDSLGLQYYYRHPRNYNRRGIFSIDEPSPTIRGVNRPIPQGYKINSCDPVGVNLHEVRPLTTIERSYIQTFPEHFRFHGTKTNVEQMIGNAVPVNLAKFVAQGITNYINNGGRTDLDLFNFMQDPWCLKSQFIMPEKILQQTS